MTTSSKPHRGKVEAGKSLIRRRVGNCLWILLTYAAETRHQLYHQIKPKASKDDIHENNDGIAIRPIKQGPRLTRILHLRNIETRSKGVIKPYAIPTISTYPIWLSQKLRKEPPQQKRTTIATSRTRSRSRRRASATGSPSSRRTARRRCGRTARRRRRRSSRT